MTTTVNADHRWSELSAPFPPEHIDKKPQPLKRDAKKGRCGECGGYHGLPAIHIDYVGHAYVRERLNQVDPTWRWEPLAVGEDGLPVFTRDSNGSPTGFWIRLHVLGVSKVGFGSCGPNQREAEKVLIGDAIRNAALNFGVALDLWKRGHEGEAGDDDQPRATMADLNALEVLIERKGLSWEEICERGGLDSKESLPRSRVSGLRSWLESQPDAVPETASDEPIEAPFSG